VRFAGLSEPDVEAALGELCNGLASFAELREAARGLLPLLESKANGRLLNELSPVAIRLKQGRTAKVHYEEGRPPWIQSRLQDFFGMVETPRIGAEKTPVVVHLLAPNQRAVQTTVDLAGFWERLYPAVRKELMRRYPRHQWPEKPG
jgi:ATP-dependent helicase HrpB